MPPDSSSASPLRLFRPRKRLVLVLGLLLLLAHIVGFSWHTDRAARDFDACAVPSETIPGFDEPRFFLDNDAYAWLGLTRELAANGGWRIRHTRIDNAPHGRPMHWSHIPIWSLRALAEAIRFGTGRPFVRAVELAGIWLMPLFQFILLGFAFIAGARRLGWVPSAIGVAAFLALPALADAFHPLMPDHHGLQLGAVLLSFVALQFGGMGWVCNTPSLPRSGNWPSFRILSLPTPRQARQAFIASGIFGGVALWLGATVWLFALSVIAVSAFAISPLFFHPEARPDPCTCQPDLWRLWAWTGTAVAAAAYLLEYAPRHFAMRLEVNHPLYWIAWLGLAECLRFAVLPPARRRAEWIPAALGVLALAALPLAIALGPAAWHQLHTPLLQRLHARFINEFQPAFPELLDHPVRFLFGKAGVLPLIALVLAIRRPWGRRGLLPEEAVCRSALVFALLFFLLMLLQLRWGFYFIGALAWIAALAVARWSAPSRPRWLLRGAVILLLLNFTGADLFRLRAEHHAASARTVPSDWIKATLAKRTALRLGLAAGTNQWRMVGWATDAPMIHYFSGIRPVASYYWENTSGWQAEAAFMADAPDGRQALVITRERGLTHAWARPSDALPTVYVNLLSDATRLSVIRHSIAGHLAHPDQGPLPAWIKPDSDLSALASQPTRFQTPSGIATEQIPVRLYSLQP